MAKIILFSDFARAKKQAVPHGYIGFDEIQKCMDMLYTQAGLLDELSKYAEEILHDLALHPEKFALSPDSADEYLMLCYRSRTAIIAIWISSSGMNSVGRYAVL